MKDQLIKYVDLLFAGTHNTEDIKQEILQNTLDRYDDLIAQGKTPQAAYSLSISGIGDISELLGDPVQEVAAPAVIENPCPVDAEKEHRHKKIMQAVAIGMYICCVVPLIALGNIGNGIIGVCLMFLMVAAATVLIILSSNDKEKESEKTEAEEELPSTPEQKLHKSIKDAMGTASLVLFLAISFATGSWHITWLIFPIMSAIQGIIFACMDLKEEKKYEA